MIRVPIYDHLPLSLRVGNFTRELETETHRRIKDLEDEVKMWQEYLDSTPLDATNPTQADFLKLITSRIQEALSTTLPPLRSQYETIKAWRATSP